jgi:hypothetical protein
MPRLKLVLTRPTRWRLRVSWITLHNRLVALYWRVRRAWRRWAPW